MTKPHMIKEIDLQDNEMPLEVVQTKRGFVCTTKKNKTLIWA